jgi:hypothetical protein
VRSKNWRIVEGRKINLGVGMGGGGWFRDRYIDHLGEKYEKGENLRQIERERKRKKEKKKSK